MTEVAGIRLNMFSFCCGSFLDDSNSNNGCHYGKVLSLVFLKIFFNLLDIIQNKGIPFKEAEVVLYKFF